MNQPRRTITVPLWVVALVAVTFLVIASYVAPKLLAVLLVLPILVAQFTPLFDLEIGKFKLKWGATDWFFAIVVVLVVIVLINGGSAKELLTTFLDWSKSVGLFGPATPSPSPSPT
jgi:hypothetical protein